MKPETIIGICSMFVALLALAVSIYQSALTRQHNRKSVRPVLELRTGFRAGAKAGLQLINSGLGPAVVTGSTLKLDGRLLGNYDESAVNKLRGEDRPRPSAVTLGSEPILATDYDEFLLSVDSFDIGNPMHAQLVELVKKRTSLEIRYESIYGKESLVTTWPRKQPRAVATEAF